MHACIHTYIHIYMHDILVRCYAKRKRRGSGGISTLAGTRALCSLVMRAPKPSLLLLLFPPPHTPPFSSHSSFPPPYPPPPLIVMPPLAPSNSL